MSRLKQLRERLADKARWFIFRVIKMPVTVPQSVLDLITTAEESRDAAVTSDAAVASANAALVTAQDGVKSATDAQLAAHQKAGSDLTAALDGVKSVLSIPA